jgi:hypothetical protein
LGVSNKKTQRGTNSNYKIYLNKIHEGVHLDETLNNVIEEKSKWKEIDFLKKLPVFEVKCEQKLPLEETIIPLMKRKILSFIYQTINNNLKNFDTNK